MLKSHRWYHQTPTISQKRRLALLNSPCKALACINNLLALYSNLARIGPSNTASSIHSILSISPPHTIPKTSILTSNHYRHNQIKSNLSSHSRNNRISTSLNNRPHTQTKARSHTQPKAHPPLSFTNALASPQLPKRPLATVVQVILANAVLGRQKKKTHSCSV